MGRGTDRLTLFLLARPSGYPTGGDRPYEIAVVFSLPVFSGGPILFAASPPYKLPHVLAKYSPSLKVYIYHEKEGIFK